MIIREMSEHESKKKDAHSSTLVVNSILTRSPTTGELQLYFSAAECFQKAATPPAHKC